MYEFASTASASASLPILAHLLRSSGSGHHQRLSRTHTRVFNGDAAAPLNVRPAIQEPHEQSAALHLQARSRWQPSHDSSIPRLNRHIPLPNPKHPLNPRQRLQSRQKHLLPRCGSLLWLRTKRRSYPSATYHLRLIKVCAKDQLISAGYLCLAQQTVYDSRFQRRLVRAVYGMFGFCGLLASVAAIGILCRAWGLSQEVANPLFLVNILLTGANALTIALSIRHGWRVPRYLEV